MSMPLHSISRSGSISTVKTPASPYDPLSSALAAAQARYTIANPESLKAHNDACQDLPGGNTRTVLHSSPFPMTFGMYFFLHSSDIKMSILLVLLLGLDLNGDVSFRKDAIYF
jgi:hypothetical protein